MEAVIVLSFNTQDGISLHYKKKPTLKSQRPNMKFVSCSRRLNAGQGNSLPYSEFRHLDTFHLIAPPFPTIASRVAATGKQESGCYKN